MIVCAFIGVSMYICKDTDNHTEIKRQMSICMIVCAFIGVSMYICKDTDNHTEIKRQMSICMIVCACVGVSMYINCSKKYGISLSKIKVL